MIFTPKRAPDTSFTVRLTPSMATEPFGAMKEASSSGASKTKRTESASRRRSPIRAMPSTWPATRCPPSSSPTRNDFSRLTGLPSSHSPIVVQARVSADAWTENSPGATPTTVRHTPEQAIEAPSAIAEVSNAVAIVSSARSPRCSRRNRPRSVMMPVNIRSNYGFMTGFARVSSRGQECDCADRRMTRWPGTAPGGAGSRLRPAQGRGEVAAAFLDEVERNTGMDATLAVEEFRMIVERHDGAVPDVRVDVEPATAVAPKGHELLRTDVVSRQGERHDKALAIQRIKELAAIRVIVGAPDQRTFAHSTGATRCGLFRPRAPAEEIAVADGVVPGVERVALPAELEQSFGHTALIARILVDRSPPLGRPANDLDREGFWFVDEAAVARQSVIACDDEGRHMNLPHTRRRHIGDLSKVGLHGDISPIDGGLIECDAFMRRSAKKFEPIRAPARCPDWCNPAGRMWQ